MKPGDRLSESIDKGLTNCKRAALLVTPTFLKNKGWTNAEMSALLTRAITEKNVIIPIWFGVDDKQVKARSAMLADLVAITKFDNIDALAAKIFTRIQAGKSI